MEEMKKLIEELNYHTKLYDEGRPIISDKEWDSMYFRLQEMEHDTGIYLPDSPTQKVNYQVVNQLNKVEHNHPMLSLDKTKDINEILSFVKDRSFIGMAKMDGLTCSLHYADGQFISAETRGNGVEGEDVTHNALVIPSIPKRINCKEDLTIDGEIICTYNDFEQFSDEYKNPRNFASGSIRLLDSIECSKRKLTFVAWDCVEGLDSLVYLSSRLEHLRELNFTTVPFFIGGIGSDLNDLEQQSNFIKEECKMLGYPIDGLVFKYDDSNEYKAAGRTDHHFKGGLAYKFYDEEYETTLENIEWTMGRTGVLTPVAIFKPIEIDGTEVSRASMHNLSVMEELFYGWHPAVSQKIYIYKANQIIPQVARAEKMKDNIRLCFDIPSECPYCNQPTEIRKENDTEFLYCTNPTCEGKLVNRIDHFFGKKGLDAKGLSKATIEKLIDWGWINGIKDVFLLYEHADEWKNKAGFGERSVSNIIGAIKDSCNTNLEAVLSAAGIPLVGRTVARQINSQFSSYQDFRTAVSGDFDFQSLAGFGYEMNKSLKNFNYDELDYIVENYLTIEKQIEANENNKKLENLTFCITGKITNWKNRDELVKYIEDLGGKCVSSVSANVNYLINNDINSTSAKNKKAKELNIEIIDEQTFIKKFDLEK